MRNERFSNNDYFRMGAAVAVGELFDGGHLGNKAEVAAETRSFLESFGLKNLQDIRQLGIVGPYASDFEELYIDERSSQ